MSTIEPLGNRLVIRRDPTDATTAAGLVKLNVQPQNRGVVLAVGPAVAILKVGDRVQFTHLAGLVLADLGEEHPADLVIMREDEVLARIAPEPNATE